jgi:hypothetical protein
VEEEAGFAKHVDRVDQPNINYELRSDSHAPLRLGTK